MGRTWSRTHRHTQQAGARNRAYLCSTARERPFSCAQIAAGEGLHSSEQATPCGRAVRAGTNARGATLRKDGRPIDTLSLGRFLVELFP